MCSHVGRAEVPTATTGFTIGEGALQKTWKWAGRGEGSGVWSIYYLQKGITNSPFQRILKLYRTFQTHHLHNRTLSPLRDPSSTKLNLDLEARPFYETGSQALPPHQSPRHRGPHLLGHQLLQWEQRLINHDPEGTESAAKTSHLWRHPQRLEFLQWKDRGLS